MEFVNHAIATWNEIAKTRSELIPAPLMPPPGFAKDIMRAKSEQPDLEEWRRHMLIVAQMESGAMQRLPVRSLQMLLKPKPNEKDLDIMLWRVTEWDNWGKEKAPISDNGPSRKIHFGTKEYYDAHGYGTKDNEDFEWDQEAHLKRLEKLGMLD